MTNINSSYRWGKNEYGSRYHFSYYSQFGERDEAAAVEVTILLITFISAIIVNAGMAVCVLRYKEIRTPTNLCLVNLAAADLLFALGIPVVAYTRLTQSWKLGDVVCALLPYSELYFFVFQYVCGFVLLWTLTVISIDRHKCLAVAPYRSILTNRRVLFICLTTWIVAFLVFLPVAIWFKPRAVSGGVTICTLVFPQKSVVKISLIFTIVTLTFTCLLPMSLLVYYYQQILKKILNTRDRWAVPCVAQDLTADKGNRRDSELSVVGSLIPWVGRKSSTTSVVERTGRTGSLSQHEEIRLHKHIRVMRILLLNVVAVLVMWLPITIIALLLFIDAQRPPEQADFFMRSHHFIWALITAQLNTVVNPILYGVFSENFRVCVNKILRRSNKNDEQEDRSANGSKKSVKSLDTVQNRFGGPKIHNSFRNSLKQPKSSSCSMGSIIEMPCSEKI
ncbi:PREDICTED: free fatty acid receptor 4-like isoform X1 [Polistes dominula]|uniref:Free fatty acid receptor 4-like isoform X1 n=1 Tax=Polistes dominula TaxID=743375 RepID=A0ABM1I9L1_POLDO|nr:PREDICTED: free fatty acid receptor 4-like isoform X1 [Polistes dominula]XP_015176895.1 PREDICTED: free fatty acid receptor 4-like isoform X1 [Polistes dominula]XP_015176896.1 PREDICTED: free fatty acid receptor 4-like isoform X1 [Polistes dominula]XP_015176897.1 PREDICTED: free fatty acid receptor 4-like isoform X1 [Polistes dominula]XP_015176898.1 PREDICTED: free fatty acid receptor 4-like isoform X1 [Polistes dominula]XP_015176899.1 PREDICTED: free fatty acid receptor 4-like isoform X1 [